MSDFMPLSNLVSIRSGNTPAMGNKAYWSGDMPWVSAKDFNGSRIQTSKLMLSKSGMDVAKIAKKNDLLLLVRGNLKKNIPIAICEKDVAFNQDIKCMTCKDIILPEYLLYYIQGKESEIFNLLGITGHGVAKLDTDTLKQFPVMLVSKKEQEKIVEILSDCDAVIDEHNLKISLLISKKSEYTKKLTLNIGEETKLGDVCNPQQWKTIGKDKLTESGFPVFGANGYIGYYSSANHQEDTITVTCRGATCGEVSWVCGPSYITGNSMCLDSVDQNKILKRYLFYQLQISKIKNIVSGSAQPQIIREDISNFNIRIPEMPHQEKVLKVLDGQKSEIDILQEQLTLLKKQKRGLMQKLLTGKLRVNGGKP